MNGKEAKKEPECENLNDKIISGSDKLFKKFRNHMDIRVFDTFIYYFSFPEYTEVSIDDIINKIDYLNINNNHDEIKDSLEHLIKEGIINRIHENNEILYILSGNELTYGIYEKHIRKYWMLMNEKLKNTK